MHTTYTPPYAHTMCPGQCKHHTKPLSPGDVREFENVLQRKGVYHLTCTGILVSHSGLVLCLTCSESYSGWFLPPQAQQALQKLPKLTR